MSTGRQSSPAGDLSWLARNVSEWQVPSKPYAIVVDHEDKKYVGYTDEAAITPIHIEQWAAERKRLGLDSDDKESLTTEWDGEGLPPVGVEFEYDVGFQDWQRAKCVARGHENWAPAAALQLPKKMIIIDEGALSRVRPLRTKEQRMRDELILLFSNAGTDEEAVDVILAAGYRKQEVRS